MATEAIELVNLAIGFGERVLMRDINVSIHKGEIFFILGNSGCGKSTLLRRIIGLERPLSGDILIDGKSIVSINSDELRLRMRDFGVSFQNGALLGSMTVGENVALPLEHNTDLSASEIRKIVLEKLHLVDLDGFADYMPSELSGGMLKRAGLARAIALNPHYLFFDEPSAGLDPLTSASLDKLILSLRDTIGVTIVIVSHELDSIFSIADRIMMLDKARKTAVAIGNPHDLAEHSDDEWVRNFLKRSGTRG